MTSEVADNMADGIFCPVSQFVTSFLSPDPDPEDRATGIILFV